MCCLHPSARRQSYPIWTIDDSLRLSTCSTYLIEMSLSQYHTAWYQRRGPDSRTIKIVPVNIKQLLVDPIALAVWYLDDGTKRDNCNACRFATQSFSLNENELLVSCLKDNFGLVVTIETWHPTTSNKDNAWSVLAKQGWKFLILQRHHLPIRRGRDTKHAL